ncbi:unnamed protein product [Durusdinium trenchii]|uniref:Reverse transcriptase domain-containing protein n=1 Tax=Durusdinium trenchii TaxID=1381693 RepID=A0ABP0SUB8_9DINO
MAVHMPDSMLKCLYDHLTLSPAELVKKRIRVFSEWTSWAKDLQRDEIALKNPMNPDARVLLTQKRIMLMKKVAQSMAWPDLAVFDEMSQGFRISGFATKSNIFQTGLKAASMSEEQLMRDTNFMRPALLGKIRSQRDDEFSRELFEMTVEEASNKRWLQGPLTPTQVSDVVGDKWMPVRRFGILQKEKLRPIDDFKENQVNDTFSRAEKVTLYALDYLIWAVLALVRLYKSGGEFSYTLSTGERLVGHVHQDWLSCDSEFLITALDLKSAYKQLPLHPKDQAKAVVSLWSHQHNDVRCFVTKTLPFGAAGSVRNFLRVSAFLHAAGCQLGILWSNYFDDFPIVTHQKNTSSTMVAAKGLLSLFGFTYAQDKLNPFGKQTEVLGVVVDLADTPKGAVRVTNKPSRVDDLTVALNDILGAGSVVPSQLPSILGKLQYADAQVWGRAGRLALAQLRELGHTSTQRVQLDPCQLQSFDILKRRLCSGKPRKFVADVVEKPWIIFSDGALEYKDGKAIATIGGVAFPPGGRPEVFGGFVPDDLMSRWQAGGKTHVIGLVELYAGIVSLLHWKPRITSSRVILFVDNWPALDVLVKGTSIEPEWRDMLLCIEDPEEDQFMLWLARVPSPSNLADHPSRGISSTSAGLNFNVSTPDGQVLQLTCPDGVSAGMVVSFACAHQAVNRKSVTLDTAGTESIAMHEDDRLRLEEGAAIAAVLSQVFLTALGPLYTVYLGSAEDGTYITKNCEESDLRAFFG